MGTTIKLRRDTEVDVQSNIPQEYEPIIQIEKTLTGGPQSGTAVKDYWLYLGDGEVAGGYPIPSANDIFAMVSYAIDQTKVLSKQLAIGELGGGDDFLPLAGGEMSGPISGNNALNLYSNTDSFGMNLTLSYDSGTPANSSASFSYSTDGLSYKYPFSVASTGIISLGKTAAIAATISPSALTVSRAFTLPDVAGEIAVVSGGTSTTVVTGLRANAGAYMTGQISVLSGLGITVSQGASPNTITITATGATAPAAHATTHSSGGSDPITISNLAGTLSVAQQGAISLTNVTGTVNSTQHGNQSATTTTMHCAQSISIVGTGIGGNTNLEQHATNAAIHYSLHAATHTSGSTDPITVSNLAGTITAGQHGTTLPWSTSKHILDAHMLPNANWTYDLGSASPTPSPMGWRNIYARQLELTSIYTNRAWITGESITASSNFTFIWQPTTGNLVRIGKDIGGSGNVMSMYGNIIMNSATILSLTEPTIDTSAATLLTVKKAKRCTYIVDGSGSGYGDYTTLDSALVALGSSDGDIFIKKGTYTISASATYAAMGNVSIIGESGATLSAASLKTLSFNSASYLKTITISNLILSNIQIGTSAWKKSTIERIIGTNSFISASDANVTVQNCFITSGSIAANSYTTNGSCYILNNNVNNSLYGPTSFSSINCGVSSSHAVISGNVITMYQNAAAGDIYGLEINATGTVDIFDNIFNGYASWGASNNIHGIIVTSSATDVITVHHNTFHNFVSTSTSSTTIHCVYTISLLIARCNIFHNCGSYYYCEPSLTINKLAGSDYSF